MDDTGQPLNALLIDAVITRVIGPRPDAATSSHAIARRFAALGRIARVSSLFRDHVFNHSSAWDVLGFEAVSNYAKSHSVTLPCRRRWTLCRDVKHYTELTPVMTRILAADLPQRREFYVGHILSHVALVNKVSQLASRIHACERGKKTVAARMHTLRAQADKYDETLRQARGGLAAHDAMKQAWGCSSETPQELNQTTGRCVLCNIGGARFRPQRCPSPSFVHGDCEQAYWIRRSLLDYPKMARCPCGIHTVYRHPDRPRLKRGALDHSCFKFRWDNAGPWKDFRVEVTSSSCRYDDILRMVDAAHEASDSSNSLADMFDAIPILVSLGPRR